MKNDHHHLPSANCETCQVVETSHGIYEPIHGLGLTNREKIDVLKPFDRGFEHASVDRVEVKMNGEKILHALLLIRALTSITEFALALSAPSPPSSLTCRSTTSIHSSATSRRGFLVRDLLKNGASTITAGSAASVMLLTSPIEAKAFPFPSNSERRQLELCTCTILRLKYWSENVAISMQRSIDRNPNVPLTDAMKGSYLEARLGAKAALTGKIGGGSNSQVYQLATFQLRGCIKDAISYSNEIYKEEIKNAKNNTEKGQLKIQKQMMDDAARDIIESIAAVVEFDGLDNVQDPSPRSSLALAQYTDDKAKYVKRLLLERTVPACNTFIRGFGAEKMRFVETYVSRTYPNELPPSLRVSASASSNTTVNGGTGGVSI